MSSPPVFLDDPVEPIPLAFISKFQEMSLRAGTVNKVVIHRVSDDQLGGDSIHVRPLYSERDVLALIGYARRMRDLADQLQLRCP